MTLTILVLTNVFDQFRVERDAYSSHLIILIHSLVAEAVFEETGTNAVLMVN